MVRIYEMTDLVSTERKWIVLRKYVGDINIRVPQYVPFITATLSWSLSGEMHGYNEASVSRGPNLYKSRWNESPPKEGDTQKSN